MTMAKDKERITMIEETLVAAHRARPAISPGGGWEGRVMARLRCEALPGGEAEWPAFVQRAVWRFAAAAGTFALILSVYALSRGITPERLAARLFLDDPAGIAASLIVPL